MAFYSANTEKTKNGYQISWKGINVDEVETRIQNIQKVTKEDVIRFAKNVYLDTIFLLEHI